MPDLKGEIIGTGPKGVIAAGCWIRDPCAVRMNLYAFVPAHFPDIFAQVVDVAGIAAMLGTPNILCGDDGSAALERRQVPGAFLRVVVAGDEDGGEDSEDSDNDQ